MFKLVSRIYEAIKSSKEMEELYTDAKQLLSDTEFLFHHTVNRLRHRDQCKQEVDVYAFDKKINDLEVEVRRKAYTHIISGRDVKMYQSALTIALIAHDMERIGDYSKNIYDLSLDYDKSMEFGRYGHDITRVEDIILEELRRALLYFRGEDSDVHKDISYELTRANSIIEELLTESKKKADENEFASNKDLINMVLYLRFLKRVSSHLRNISTSYHNSIDRIGFKLEENQGKKESE